MTSLRLSEPIIEAVRQKLRDNMPGRVAVINADQSLPDLQPPLKAPDAYYTAPRNPLPPSMPAIVVMDGAMTIAQNNEGPHSLITETEIAVFIVDEHPDREVLGKRLQRLNRAVIESLWDGEPQERLVLADGSFAAFRIFPSRVTPGPMLDNPDRPDVPRSFQVTVFQVRQLEE